MNAPGYFVTGTDTEVGKTLIACALILQLRHVSPSLKISGFKPVVAGTYEDTNGQRSNEDLLSLIAASGLAQTPSQICPYILDTPAAPHLVARALGLEMSLHTILKSLNVVQAQSDRVILEGAGGFLVPLNAQESLADLATQLNWPVVLVVGLRLGCLNHALVSLEAIESRGLKVAAWVANSIDAQMAYQQENLLDLQARIRAPFLGHVPQLPTGLQKAANAPYSIQAMQWAGKHLDVGLLS